MNPFTAFFTLASRQADVRRFLALWASIKAPATEMIDLGRDLLGSIGVLEDAPVTATPVVPEALRKYDTKWVQATLNTLQNAGLRVDGDLGNSDSASRHAVKAFQQQHPPLTIDGNPGVQTVAVMQMALEKLNPKIM